MFYTINFENKISEHLAEIVLLHSDDKFERINIEQLKQAKAAILDKKTLILITDNSTVIDTSIPNFEVIVKTEDEVIDLLRKKDLTMLQLLKNGIVLFGEDNVVRIIKNCVSRF